MKYIQIFIVLILLAQTIFSQRQITDSDKTVMKTKIENEVADLRKKIDTNIYTSAYEKQMNLDFKIDTYRIDTLMKRMISVDFSNQGMVQATIDATVSYDKLLNKYYKMLMNKLSSVDQESLKQTQRNWILYRDSEIKLISTLSNVEYSGVGLDQRLFAAADVLDITKSRVNVIVDYLIRIQK